MARTDGPAAPSHSSLGCKCSSQQPQQQCREQEKTRTSLKRKKNEGERGQGAEMKGEYLRPEQSLSFAVKCEEIVCS